MAHFMVGVDWYGPYTKADACTAAANDYVGGLYMCIGRQAYERSASLQYIGISKESLGTRLRQSPKLSSLSSGEKIWLGEIGTAERPGRKRKMTPATLDAAEWLHVYFLSLPLNEKKRINAPTKPVTVMNRWWRPDYETPHRRPHPDWPDLIDFMGPDYPARIVWFGKQQKVLPQNVM